MRRIILLAALLTCRAEHALGQEEAVSRSALLVLVRDMTAVSTTTVDLHQKVMQDITEKKTWLMYPSQAALAMLNREHPGYSLGSLPAIPRREFIANAKAMMPTVQELLDTLAVPGALLVDCEPSEDDKVSSCSLSYYDRKAQRVTASARKGFAVPVSDATRWAPMLTMTLKQGLSQEKDRSDRKILDDMLRRQEADDRGFSKFRVTAGVHSEATNVGESTIRSLPVFSLGLGVSGNDKAIGLEFSYGASERGQDGLMDQVSYKGIGLALALSSRALESLEWQIGVNAGVMSRQMSREMDGGELTSQDPYIGISPGLFWAAGYGFALGVEGRFVHYFSGKGTEDGVFEGEAFAKQDFGIGLALRMDF